MDLSFHRTRTFPAQGMKSLGLRSVTHAPSPSLSLMLSAHAAAQAASPTAKLCAAVLRGQEGEEDWVQVLADMFAPRTSGMIEAGRLAGSFNPLIASHLRVGQ